MTSSKSDALQKRDDDLYCGGDCHMPQNNHYLGFDLVTRLLTCKPPPHHSTCNLPLSKVYVPLLAPRKSLAVSSLTALNLWTHSNQPWPICNLTTMLSGTSAFVKDLPLHKMPSARTSLSSSLVPLTSFGL